MRHDLILIGILPLLFLLTATAHGADEAVYSDRERRSSRLCPNEVMRMSPRKLYTVAR